MKKPWISGWLLLAVLWLVMPPSVAISADGVAQRFRSYQPNYIIYQATDDDENSFEGHYSFRYIITDLDCAAMRNKEAGFVAEKAAQCWPEIYLTYTGEFDFYVGTRESGPVVNRVSNPALHWRKYFDGKEAIRIERALGSPEWINISFEHRSDGQVSPANELVDPGGLNEHFRAEDELNAGNHAYFDSISRGANYVAVETKHNFKLPRTKDRDCDDLFQCFVLYTSIKPFYLNQDSRIYWGSLANSKVKITDYDRYRVILKNSFRGLIQEGESATLGIEWTVGDSWLMRDSINVNFAFDFQAKSLFGLPTGPALWPFYVRFHAGPMSTLSNYTKKQRSIGFGLIFQSS